MAMPKSTPRRPGKPGQNRDSRDGVFGHPEGQVGPLPRVGLYARVSTPHSAHDRDAAAAAARVPGTVSLAGGPRCRRSRLRIQAAPGERPSTRRCAAARDRHHRERNLPISGPAGSLRVIFHTVAAQAPSRARIPQPLARAALRFFRFPSLPAGINADDSDPPGDPGRRATLHAYAGPRDPPLFGGGSLSSSPIFLDRHRWGR